jgi:hypothetical protein
VSRTSKSRASASSAACWSGSGASGDGKERASTPATPLTKRCSSCCGGPSVRQPIAISTANNTTIATTVA